MGGRGFDDELESLGDVCWLLRSSDVTLETVLQTFRLLRKEFCWNTRSGNRGVEMC